MAPSLALSLSHVNDLEPGSINLGVQKAAFIQGGPIYAVCNEQIRRVSGHHVNAHWCTSSGVSFTLVKSGEHEGGGDRMGVSCQSNPAFLLLLSLGISISEVERVTILGLKADKTYTFSFRSCLSKETIPQSCDLRATHLTVKQGQYPAKPKDLPNQNHLRQNATETEPEEAAPAVRVFHVLLGLAVFIFMTLLFVFGTLLLHRRKPTPETSEFTKLASVINPTATEYRNTLFQISNTGYHQLPVIDPNCIEIVKSIGKGRFGETFLGNMKSLPPVDNNTSPARKVFLRPALPKTVIEAAEIASSVRHPKIVFCHGILKAVQPNLLVYNYMACGRLDRLLVSIKIAEIPKIEASPGFTTSNSGYKSNSLSIGDFTFLTNDSRLRVQEFEPIFYRLAAIMTNIANISSNIIGCYASKDSSPNFLEKDSFYRQLDAELRENIITTEILAAHLAKIFMQVT
ncbi:hypothetical protein ACTXT7_011370 [Hymenolepis weldensis]